MTPYFCSNLKYSTHNIILWSGINFENSSFQESTLFAIPLQRQHKTEKYLNNLKFNLTMEETLNKNFEQDIQVFNWTAKEDARTKLEHERNLRELGIESL